jgi:hypothetical protein
MYDQTALKEKVRKLELDADIIEKMIDNVFRNIEVNKTHYQIEFIPPTGKLKEAHKELISWYESWYTQSHLLIHTYCPQKESDFKKLHNSIVVDDERPQFKGHKLTTYSGISERLQLNVHLGPEISREKFIQQLMSSFIQQKAILIGIPEVFHLCTPEPAKAGILPKEPSSTPLQQNFYLAATGIDKSTNNVTIVQNFSQIYDFINENVHGKEKKEELLRQIKELETTRDFSSYLTKYQKFIASLADHVTVFYPVLQFLLQNLQNFPK